MIKKILLNTLLFLFCLQVNAQLVNVNSSSSSPTAPLECNDFLITVNGVVNCINYQFDSTSFSVVGNTIEVGVYYTGGFICAGALSPYSYQVNLGNIPQGTYTVSLKGFLNLVVDDALNAPSVTIGSCCGTDASFTSNKAVGCTDDTDNFIFTNTSTGTTSNEWYLDNLFVGSSTDLTLPISTIGSYEIKLITSDGSCLDSMTQVFDVFQSPTISLGNDTSSCVGLVYNINAPTGFTSYNWTNNSSTTNIASVSNTNTYQVNAIDSNGCSANDSILITFYAPPVFSLGNDTTICANENLILDPGAYSLYNWNTSETTQTISVNSSFNYSVEVTDNNGCKSSDAISVFVNAIPNVDLGQDTFEICDGNTVTLDAGNFVNYLWSTGEATQTVSISTESPISVGVLDGNGCGNIASTYVKVNAVPLPNFGSDTAVFCSGTSVTLNPGSFNSYSWNNATVGATLDANAEGNYSVNVTDGNNCSNNASIYVKENANPVVDLGSDADLCATDKIVLNAGVFASYLWNDASTNATLEVNGPDFTLGNNSFNVSVMDDNGCSGSDEIILNIKDCNVGISSIALENSISIYPIPTKNTLNIETDKKTISNINVYDVLGKQVLVLNSKTLNQYSSIDISSLNEGIYFLEIIVENEKLIKQFLKTK